MYDATYTLLGRLIVKAIKYCKENFFTNKTTLVRMFHDKGNILCGCVTRTTWYLKVFPLISFRANPCYRLFFVYGRYPYYDQLFKWEAENVILGEFQQIPYIPIDAKTANYLNDGNLLDYIEKEIKKLNNENKELQDARC